MTKEKEKNLNYSIIFDVPEGGVEVNTFVEGMQDCLLALEEINNAIVGGIDTSIQVISYIERLSAGSVDFELKDQIKSAKNDKAEKAIEATVAGISGICGDPSAVILISLKAAKDAIFKINEKRISNKDKKEEIKSEITTILKNSNLNNDLKGYYLDEKRLNNAIGHFAKGVKKTGDNVFYKGSPEAEKQRVNSSLSEPSDDEFEIAKSEDEGTILGENTTDKTLILLTATSKEGCMWEFEDENKFKCTIEDEEFFKNYAAGKIALHGREIMKVKLKTVQKLLEGKKIKNEYFALKLEITDNPAPQFNFGK